jgi:hypothetical protein
VRPSGPSNSGKRADHTAQAKEDRTEGGSLSYQTLLVDSTPCPPSCFTSPMDSATCRIPCGYGRGRCQGWEEHGCTGPRIERGKGTVMNTFTTLVSRLGRRVARVLVTGPVPSVILVGVVALAGFGAKAVTTGSEHPDQHRAPSLGMRRPQLQHRGARAHHAPLLLQSAFVAPLVRSSTGTPSTVRSRSTRAR